ncbi:glycoside hydrolase family 2 TIM barrel-domain containing protein [Sphingorhabdus sp.]|jgi:beta-galactosidase|uniref:glycoside hydrolase family 2 TIM barrel-domain containing protein n=1 Tax=Sphingorhabdus sp. TaxID=1902408 RepID=UPI004047AC95
MLKAAAATGVAVAMSGGAAAKAKLNDESRKAGPKRDLPFDSDWRFHLGDVAGAESLSFDDSNWRNLSLPHDWSIEDRPGSPKEAEGWVPPVALWNLGPHPKDAKPVSPEVPIVMASVHPTVPGGPPRKVGPFDVDKTGFGWGMGWTVGGTGWYRKHFALTDLAVGEKIEIRFDGAYLVTDVWINGVKLGRNTNGYMGFAFDLTPHLKADGHNILAVKVANEGETARWYSGSGLFRHVWLSRTGAVRVPLYGVSTNTVLANSDAATVAVGVEVDNLGGQARQVSYKIVARNGKGRVVANTGGTLSVAAGKTGKISAELAFTKPALWSPEAPNLHIAEIELSSDGAVTDRYTQRFGIRTISASPKNGLQINGRTHQLQGACLHHDHGILGAVAIDRAERRKVELAKANGFNAIRCSHNPPTPYFLDVCDAMGMIVIDEAFDCWEEPKLMKDYYDQYFKENWRRDLTNMIRRDRNHASIVFWSIGNEIHEAIKPRGVEIATMMRAAIRQHDTSRFITQAITASYSGEKGAAARAQLDVTSYNYSFNAVQKDSATYPDLTFTTTETHSYDAWDVRQNMDKNPAYMGEFLWTGQDYVGEVGSGSSRLRSKTAPPDNEKKIIFGMDVSMLNFYVWDYPAYQSGSGEIDLLGLKKPPSYYRDVVWGRSKLALFVQRPVPEGYYEAQTAWGWPDVLESWTWPEGNTQPMVIHTYSSAEEVALLLNGKEVARKKLTVADKMKVTIDVPYQPGMLTAVAYTGGKEVARKVLETVGPPAKLRLRAERDRIKGNASDLGYVFAEVLDARGMLVPDAAVPLIFEVSGAAKLRAAGSANPYGIESFQDGKTRSFHGTALSILQPVKQRGEAIVRVSSPGLAGAKLSIQLG